VTPDSQHVYYKSGYKYQTTRDFYLKTDIHPKEDIETEYIILTKGGNLFIKHGYAWDGPSGPTVDTKTNIRPSLPHDALYQLMRMGLLPQYFRSQVDDLFKKMCKEDDMCYVRRKYFFRGVRWFAGFAAKKKNAKKELRAP